MQSIFIKINSNADLIPIDVYTRQLIISELKPGVEYQCTLKKQRNVKHNSKYWVLLKALEFHFGNTDTAWHLFFKEKFLEPIVFKLKNGTVKKYPNSTAFDKMNQIEFDDFYRKVENYLIDHGYNIDELINSTEFGRE
jgi:hypothetical protein